MPEWHYSYKTSDGVRHEGCLRAVNRDGAYAELRRQGIKPIKVELAPGRLNRFLALGKRGWTILLLTGLVVALSVTLGIVQSGEEIPDEVLSPRHQITGLPENWMNMRSRYWGGAKSYLALFAQPGRMEFERVDEASNFTESGLSGDEERIERSAPQWACDLDSILVGMREEAMALFKTGKKADEIVLWLKERQRMEAAYRRQVLEGEGTDEEKTRRLEAMSL